MSRILINGLSAGTGGGLTVARELLAHLAAERPQWQFTLALSSGHPLHEEMRDRQLAENAKLLWAPASTAGRWQRSRYERSELAQWASERQVSGVLQLNGMLVSGMPAPSLVHFQDPSPYRPESWSGVRERLLAFLKRRANGVALRHAAAIGWTSHYLRELICGHHRMSPRGDVFYNGLPESWIQRAAELPDDWHSRPMELLTVSNVVPHKRHDLVIRALPRLAADPALKALLYRIAGAISDEQRRRLEQLASSLGVGDRVVIEGRVEDERVKELLARARCFVLMSVCESFGIPPIEAMSFGVPVVISDSCALPEVVGEAGSICPADDLEQLVARIFGILKNSAEAHRLQRLGAQRVARFSWRETAAEMANTLERMIGKSYAVVSNQQRPMAQAREVEWN